MRWGVGRVALSLLVWELGKLPTICSSVIMETARYSEGLVLEEFTVVAKGWKTVSSTIDITEAPLLRRRRVLFLEGCENALEFIKLSSTLN